MITLVTDTQVVGESIATLFSTINSGSSALLVTLKNTGVNTINYTFQEFDGNSWNNIGASGSPTNTTLQSDQNTSLTVSSAYAQIRLIGNASGGAFLHFSVTRTYERTNGGQLPLLSL